MKDLLKLSDLTEDELFDLLNLADQLKYERKNGIKNNALAGKKLGMIFEKASTRTRVSFEAGMFELGGHALFLSGSDLQIGRGEPVRDTARVLSRYLDGIMIRTFAQKTVEELAEFASIPVINGLTDDAHPCQALADLMTVREYRGGLKGQKLCYVGDGNNMANSLIAGCVKAGMRVCAACPEGYEPDAEIMEKARETGRFELFRSPAEAAAGADAVYTDVWASMGQEAKAAERAAAFAGYTVDAALMDHAKKDAIVLHCLPAHRGEEISAEVFEAHADEIFEQAENRLHVQKAVLLRLLG